jgi:Fe-S-cluster-containing hydrogenase component 2
MMPGPAVTTARAPGQEPPAPPRLDLAAVRAIGALRSLDDRVLRQAMQAGHLRVRDVWRDEIVADGEAIESDGEWVHLVASGQVVVALFDPDVLADERAWSAGVGEDERRHKIRPQGPLIHLADRHLAVFGPGDLFNSRAVAADPQRCAFFAALPGQLVAARPQWLGDAAARDPSLAAALGDALAASRARLSALPGARGEILDFYVRQGLSAAGTLRVVQIDRCIECRRCEEACADRHGISRLTIPGPRLGLVGFAVTCRTCADRRCLDVCNFDSIEYDDRLGEVLIRESSCTGCASCANACPYGAIQMVRLADRASERFRARLERRGSLRAGPDAARREPAEQIASKCDHCIGHADQACIVSCPTGALIEIAPPAVFAGAHGTGVPAQRPHSAGAPPLVRMAAAPRTPVPLPTAAFEAGMGARGRRILARTRAAALWTTALAGLLAAAGEIFLRKVAPTLSLQYWTLRGEGMEPALARFRVGYLAGSDLSLALGLAGSGLMLAALLYPLHRRLRALRRFGSGSAWFDLHVVGGALGPLYIVLHSAFHLYNWVAIGVWAFAAVFASGVIGRYLLTRLPDRFPGQSFAARGHEREIDRVAGAWPALAAAAAMEVERYRLFARQPAGRQPGFAAALLWIAADDLRRPLVWFGRRSRLQRAGGPSAVRRALARQVARVIQAERRVGMAARCAPFLRVWLRIHLLFTAVAVIVSLVHITWAFRFSM